MNGPEDCTTSCKSSCGTCDSTTNCVTCKMGQTLENNECVDCSS